MKNFSPGENFWLYGISLAYLEPVAYAYRVWTTAEYLNAAQLKQMFQDKL